MNTSTNQNNKNKDKQNAKHPIQKLSNHDNQGR